MTPSDSVADPSADPLATPTSDPRPAETDGPRAHAMVEPQPGAPAADRSHETTASGIPWLQFTRARTEVRREWPTPWDIRCAPDLLAILDPHPTLDRPASVLDIGATECVHRSAMTARWPGIDYRSLDIDRTFPHDYHDFAEVDRSFDLVTCFEVLEHVDEPTAVELLRSAVAVLRPGGAFVASVPNVLLAHAALEFTHRTAISHLDLGALLRLSGLEIVDFMRYATGSARARWAHQHIFARWHRFMRTDWCQSVVCVARRPLTHA